MTKDNKTDKLPLEDIEDLFGKKDKETDELPLKDIKGLFENVESPKEWPDPPPTTTEATQQKTEKPEDK